MSPDKRAARYDLIILGGGPGGYAAAIRAGQLGLKTALIEKEGVGGTCLHHGCIPSKALLRSAEIFSLIQQAGDFGIELGGEARPKMAAIMHRSEKIMKRLHQGLLHLMKKYKVDLISGLGRFVSHREIEVLGVSEGGAKQVVSDQVILSTGSRVRSWPSLPVDGKRVLTSDEALTLLALPRSMIIVGGGAVGVEMASFYSTLGVLVLMVEQASSLLPGEDWEVASLLKRHFERKGITVLTSASIRAIDDDGQQFTLRLQGVEEAIRADTVLVAIGRVPNTDRIDLRKAGVAVDPTSQAVCVDEKMQTSQRGIWAIGDVTTRPAFAHGAMAQGIYLVESMAGIERKPIDPHAVPHVIYCQPEVASVGLTEEQAKAEKMQVKTVKFPFSGNPRAVILNETEGFVKLICDDPFGHIVGAHLIGPGATELISELVLAKQLNARALDLKRVIHPHPTVSEAIMEAGGALLHQAIHF